MSFARFSRLAFPALLAFAVSACAGAAPTVTPAPSPTTTTTFAATPTAAPPAATPTRTASAPPPTATPSPTSTPTPEPEPTYTATPRPTVGDGAPLSCHWQWAYPDNAELTQAIQTRVEEAGVAGATVTAYGFGENQVCDDGSVTFHPMETDFRIALAAPGSTDLQSLEEQAARLLDILAAYPPEATPGPNDSRLDFSVDALGDRPPAAFSVRWREAQELRRQGLTGAALLKGLGYPAE